MSVLERVNTFGQSIWYDNIRRDLLTDGRFERLISMDDVRGLTSNPSIFEKAIAGSSIYEESIAERVREGTTDPQAIFESLAVTDVRLAADLLRPVYDDTGRRDGYVSLEVSPERARDTRGTIEEARRLFALIERPNLMIKVPGTVAGLEAVETLVSEGINVNVTLLFAIERYEAVLEAYLKGLERRLADGGDLASVASVASFFVSRVDSLVDSKLDAMLENETTPPAREHIDALRGRVAVANAKLAYQVFKKVARSDRWSRLREAGAQPQRLLWASTSTKNEAYRDVRYVEELIGPDTVNTVPPATLDLFRDHGEVRPTLETDLPEAHAVFVHLREAGIAIDAVTDTLETEGIAAFTKAYRAMLEAIERKVIEIGKDS